ncbi:MAG TPA: D-alanyl-D-alanine carboxypeptidase/D-alanyl-D-alanine-endopeptidase [Verrucomicrobiae bacterium]
MVEKFHFWLQNRPNNPTQTLSNIKAHWNFCFCVALFCLASNPASAQTNGAVTLPELTRQIEAQISQPRFSSALWGIKIVSLDSGKTLFENHADRLMSPASNTKLYTGALALARFGADYRIATPILASARPDSEGTVHGDLVIAGRADPSWNTRHGITNFWDLFSPFVTALNKAGVRRVTGDLIGDATFLQSPPSGSGWVASDLEDYYGAEISALTLNDNCTQIAVQPAAEPGEPCQLTIVDPCTGMQLDNHTITTPTNGAPRHIEVRRFSWEKVVHIFGNLPVGGEPEKVDVPVPRPAEWFSAALKEALRRNGIIIDGAARAVLWPSPPPVAAEKLGEVVSPPLRELIRDFMKPSQNLETDLIFEHTGEMTRDTNAPPWQTSEDCALQALDAFLATNGLPAAEVHFDEGSGLSRNNLTTANATVSLLQFMAKQGAGKDFMAALPTAGVDGTLRRRMKDTPAFQNVQAKTGTLRWANALSGFVTTAAGEHLVFSLMLNRYVTPPDYKRATDLDAIVVMLARFAGRTDESLESRFAPFGTLVITQFVTAPFPHPARAEGHAYHDEFYSARDHYSDSSVALFIPKNFRPAATVDFIVHFHGWRHSVTSTLEEYQLIQQLADSGKNAALVVPAGPYMAPDSFGGKLADTNGFKAFMDEAVEKLHASGAVGPSQFSIGKIILSAHSGGYQVMAAILDHGGLPQKIREVWLFDALYGGREIFLAWQKNQHGRLLDIYTDHGGTIEETKNLMADYKKDGVNFLAGEESAANAELLQTNQVIFLHADLPHDDVVARHGTFEQFIKSSCLENK